MSTRHASFVLVTAAAVGAELAAPAGSPGLALLDVAVAVAFAAGAAATRAVDRRLANVGLAFAAAWVAGTAVAAADLGAYATSVIVFAHRAPLALLVLAYPHVRFAGGTSRAVALAALLAPLAPADAAPTVTAAVAVVTAIVVLGSAVRVPPSWREPRTAAGGAALAIAVVETAAAAELASATALLVVYDLMLLGVATVLFGGLATGRWRATAATGLVLELGDTAPGQPITGRLAAVLGDPSLQLRIRRAGRGWTDESGRAVPAPETAATRQAVTQSTFAEGTTVALLHDRSAIPDAGTARAAVAVAATAIDNALRDAELRDQIAQLRRLRRALLDAADDERRQLGLELRAGPLHELDAIDASLAAIAGGEASALRADLARAREELEQIANGLYPRALLDEGLDATLRALAAGASADVTIDAPADELPPALALTVYYVAAEALANVVKHARATRTTVRLRAVADELVLVIADDGIGTADPAGSGLSGLDDRVRAAGGELRIASAPDAGTCVEARFRRPLRERS